MRGSQPKSQVSRGSVELLIPGMEAPAEPCEDAAGESQRTGASPFAAISRAQLPTLFGEFQIAVFQDREGKEHVKMRMGDPAGSGHPSLVRVHSECLTSEVFGSLLCDCREQLHGAMQAIAEEGSGILLYLRQEGRSVGLMNKIRAYALQQQGLDTVDANLQLGLPVDNRSFDVAAEMLRTESISSVRLITNNPQKVAELEAAGIEVVSRVSLPVADRRENRRYLQTKKQRLQHLFDRESSRP